MSQLIIAEKPSVAQTKYLVPTDKGTSLIMVMPEMIQSPSMTADWENKLLQIERGEYDPETFMEEITDMINSLVETYEAVEGADTLMKQTKVIGHCPHCNAEVVKKQKGWFCSNKNCRFVLWKNNTYFNSIGKNLTASMAEKLLEKGRIRLNNCTSRRTGKTFSATLVLTAKEDGSAQFDLEFDKPQNTKQSPKHTEK